MNGSVNQGRHGNGMQQVPHIVVLVGERRRGGTSLGSQETENIPGVGIFGSAHQLRVRRQNLTRGRGILGSTVICILDQSFISLVLPD